MRYDYQRKTAPPTASDMDDVEAFDLWLESFVGSPKGTSEARGIPVGIQDRAIVATWFHRHIEDAHARSRHGAAPDSRLWERIIAPDD